MLEKIINKRGGTNKAFISWVAALLTVCFICSISTTNNVSAVITDSVYKYACKEVNIEFVRIWDNGYTVVGGYSDERALNNWLKSNPQFEIVEVCMESNSLSSNMFVFYKYKGQ